MRFRKALKSIWSSPAEPVDVTVFLLALIGGLAAGALAQLLTQLNGVGWDPLPLAFLGWSTAVWVSIGFWFAWTAAQARTFTRGAIWGAIAMALYLFCWLFAYCAVFGLIDSSGFYSLWRDERVYELAVLPVSGVIGLLAAGAWRPGLVGSACLAVPVAWSVPEIVLSVTAGYWCGAPRWQMVLALALPTLVAAMVPVLRYRPSKMHWPIFVAVIAAGGAAAYLLLRFFSGGRL